MVVAGGAVQSDPLDHVATTQSGVDDHHYADFIRRMDDEAAASSSRRSRRSVADGGDSFPISLPSGFGTTTTSDDVSSTNNALLEHNQE